MGFIRAFTGALSGTFADQWADIYTVPETITPTTGLIQATKVGPNSGRGQNTKGYDNIISNGSQIYVPDNMALITMENNQITGVIAEAGGYTWQSNDPNSRSIFAGDGLLKSTIMSTIEKFKFGGQPGNQQTAFFINLKPISGIRFGTGDPVGFYDNYYQTRLRARLHGTYEIQIVNPIVFLKEFVPPSFLLPNAKPFDFNDDDDNPTTEQLLNDFVINLGDSINALAIDAKANGGMDTEDYIIQNRQGVGKRIGDILEANCKWTSGKGLSVGNVDISFSYDEKSQAAIDEFIMDDKEIRKMKRMTQEVYAPNMTAAAAAATGTSMINASQNPNGAMGGFVGMGFAQQQGANMINAVQQPMMYGQQPMGGYQQPMGGYQQPMQGMPQQPMGGYQQPMQGMPQQPMGGYQQPMQGMPQQPMGGYQQPMGGQAQPMPEQANMGMQQPVQAQPMPEQSADGSVANQ